MENHPEFKQWLQNEMEDRHWIQSELARRSGLSTAQISRLLVGTRGPGKGTCVAIARALRLPIDVVLRAAGILPPNFTDESADGLYQRIIQLPGDMRQQVEEYLDFLYERKRNAR